MSPTSLLSWLLPQFIELLGRHSALACAVVFFSPFIFQGLGDRFRGETGALLASLIVGGVQVQAAPSPRLASAVAPATVSGG